MKFIIANTLDELYEALSTKERNVEIKFVNNRITKFPKPCELSHEGTVVLRLYTPKLTSIKNAPCIGTQMNWLIVEQANLKKIETAAEAGINNLTVCYLPCMEDKDYDITKDTLLNSGFVRLALSWQQFTKDNLKVMQDSTDWQLKRKLLACVHEMMVNNIHKYYDGCPEFIKRIIDDAQFLSTAEQEIAKAVSSKELGELALEVI